MRTRSVRVNRSKSKKIPGVDHRDLVKQSPVRYASVDANHKSKYTIKDE